MILVPEYRRFNDSSIIRMATNSLDILVCRKCNKTLSKDSKYLGCLHIFCSPCIATMVTHDQCVRCDKCRAKTQLDKYGIEGLPSCCMGKYSELINILNEPSCNIVCHNCKSNSKPATLYCFDCQFFLCDECHLKSHMVFQAGHKRVLSTSDMKGRGLDNILELVGAPECHEHPDQSAISFSSVYKAPICGLHNAEYGTLQSINSVVRERHKTIRDKMQTSLRVAEVMKARLNDLSDLKLTILKDENEAIATANEYFDQLLKNVEKRRAEVVEEIKRKSLPSQQNVSCEVDKQENTIEKYFDAQQLIKACLDSFPNTFLVQDFSAIDWYLGHFNEKVGVKTAKLRDLHSLDIPQFIPDRNLERTLLKAGSVEGGGEQNISTKRQPKLSPRAEQIPKFLPKLSPKPKPPLPPPKKQQIPKVKTTNIIKLTDITEQPIQPWEVVCTQNNYLILDRNTNTIHVFTLNGKIENTFSFHHLHAKSTWGLALSRFDKQDRLLVSDIHYKHVIVANLSGQVLTIIHKTDKQTFGHPTGIAANNIERCVAIVDTSLKKVHIFTLTPHFVKSLGGDWLENPTAICSDNKGNYVVLDSSEPIKFVVLNSAQNFVKHIYPPFEEIAIEMPQSISVNKDGHLYWSDTRTRSIVLVREDGSLLDIIGGNKEGIQFRSPAGICNDFRGSLVVCDALSNCLVIVWR